MTLEDDMRVVARFDSQDEAAAAAKLLTRHGIGSLVETGHVSESTSGPAPGPVEQDRDETGPVGGEASYSVLVVLDDLARACEMLGVEPPEGLDEELAQRRRRRFPDWVYVVAIFVVALITLPLVAYFVAFKASGG